MYNNVPYIIPNTLYKKITPICDKTNFNSITVKMYFNFQSNLV